MGKNLMAHKKHIVKQGECISSIGFKYGFFPDSIRDDPQNSELKEKRGDLSVLFPGDEIYIREKEVTNELCTSEQRHRFRRKGVPAKVSLQLMEYGKPRANLKYELNIGDTVITGTTDAEGRIEQWIPPSARKATLSCGADEQYDLALGNLNPADELPSTPVTSKEWRDAGVEQRLQNLGYFDDEEEMDEEDEEVWDNEELEPGELPRKIRMALEAFQDDHELHISGELDDKTLATLIKAHGS